MSKQFYFKQFSYARVHSLALFDSITGASASDYLVSYPGYSLGESYPSADLQPVYSAAPADRARFWFRHITFGSLVKF